MRQRQARPGAGVAWPVLLLAGTLALPAAVPAAATFTSTSTYSASSSRPLPPDYRVHADGSVTLHICFNWSCSSRQRLVFTAADMREVARQMAICPGDGTHERLQRLRIGIWQMETLAQKYQPLLANDDAINTKDGGLEGRMDCVDNVSNTTTYLRVLQELDLIPGWSLAPSQVRDLFSFDVHWTAVVVDTKRRQPWSVDSWLRPNGHLPFVMPLADWSRGESPWEAPFSRRNPYPSHIEQLCS